MIKLVLIFFLATLLLLLNVNTIVRVEYMDELFHITQVKNFLKGDFRLDPKITTPPLLYYITVIYCKLLSFLFNGLLCDVSLIRSINLLFSAGTLVVLYKMTKDAFFSAALLLFPLIYFFNFIFYTDLASLFFVLMGIHYESALVVITLMYSVGLRVF